MSTISSSGLVSTELERSVEVLQQMYTFMEEVRSCYVTVRMLGSPRLPDSYITLKS